MRALLLIRDGAAIVAIAVALALGLGWLRYDTVPADVAGVVATMVVWVVLGLVLVVAPSWVITQVLVWSWHTARQVAAALRPVAAARPLPLPLPPAETFPGSG